MPHNGSRTTSRTIQIIGGAALTLLLTATAIPAQAAAPLQTNATVKALVTQGVVTATAETGRNSVDGASQAVSSVDRGVTLDPTVGLGVRSHEGALTVTPVTGRSAVQTTGDVLVYASQDQSYDFALTKAGPTATADAAYVVIHDGSAPTSYGFRFTVDGQPARLSVEAGTVVVRNAAGKVVNSVLPAWATDAAGKAIPTSYSVAGEVLTQTVEHRGAAYPVVADPRTACDWVYCTIEFNRSETRSIAGSSGTAAFLLAAGCKALGNNIGFFVCGLYAAALRDAASSAVNVGRCVGMRAIHYPIGVASLPYPVIYSGGNCR
jgi:hypothetical protein